MVASAAIPPEATSTLESAEWPSDRRTMQSVGMTKTVPCCACRPRRCALGDWRPNNGESDDKAAFLSSLRSVRVAQGAVCFSMHFKATDIALSRVQHGGPDFIRRDAE